MYCKVTQMCAVLNQTKGCVENCISLLRMSGSIHLAQPRAQEAHYSLCASTITGTALWCAQYCNVLQIHDLTPALPFTMT